MPTTIDQLHRDHRRLRHALATTAKIADEFRTGPTEESSDHVYCLIDYLCGYPHEVHHPTEDLVFAALLSQKLEAEPAERVRQNQRQHRNLEEATAALKERFDLIDETGDVDAFIEALDQYTRLQLEHMQFEEQHVFPLALKHFSAAVWKKLDQQHGNHEDPLFDKADRHYAALYRHIVFDPEEPDSMSVSDALLRYLNATAIG